MDYENKDWELSFKDMLFAVLYQWKKILVVTIALAIVLGGYRMWDLSNSTVSQETKAQTQTELDDCNEDILKLEKEIASTESKIAAQELYMEESVLMQMDAHTASQARVSLYITTDYQIMPDMVYQSENTIDSIMVIYTAVLTNNDVMEQVAAEIGIKAEHLTELVTITKNVNHILDISVIHPDGEVAEQVIELLLEHVDAAKLRATEVISEHSVSVVIETIARYLDSEKIVDKQEDGADTLENLKEDLTDQTEDLTELFESREKLEKDVESQNAPISLTKLLRGGIIFAVLGGAAGAVLSAGVICCGFVFRDSIYSGNELRLRMKVNLLGSVIGRKKKWDIITRGIRKIEGRLLENSDENLALIAENIRCYSADAVNVLIVGDADPQQIQELADNLQKNLGNMKLTHSGTYLSDAAALRKLMDCDGVVLVETCCKSKYSTIARELGYISDTKKRFIGCVVVE